MESKNTTIAKNQTKGQEWPLRFVVCHIHHTSARLRFLWSDTNSVVLPNPLPKLAELLLPDEVGTGFLAAHPATYLQQLSQLLQVSSQCLTITSEFRSWVDTPGRVVPIYLARVLGEQPFSPGKSFQWIELPDSFGLLPIERLILRQIYDFLLGNE